VWLTVVKGAEARGCRTASAVWCVVDQLPCAYAPLHLDELQLCHKCVTLHLACLFASLAPKHMPVGTVIAHIHSCTLPGKQQRLPAATSVAQQHLSSRCPPTDCLLLLCSCRAEIARHMQGRTDQQCLARWTRHLDPAINRVRGDGERQASQPQTCFAVHVLYAAGLLQVA
jgi:hypothetical protein